jgi:anti-anti-sigma factor
MDISYSKKPNVLIIYLAGLFEYHDEAKIINFMHERVKEAPSTIAVDLTRVDTINSAGIAALLSILRIADENRINFVLYGMNQKVLLLLEKVFSRDFVPLLSEEEFRDRFF